MDVPIRSNGEIDFSTLEGNVKNHILANPFENVSELTADEFELRELVNYFGASDDFNFKYNESLGGKYEIKISAKL